ncbi:MAG: SUMF1/EgtB/PvdO family nonheme iron enzyme [Micromonosporaceae bacterium]|nr:SUMF1/EgtB/PvdO family nonheme iron enzyme [Micromonosporaceae bacterium]
MRSKETCMTTTVPQWTGREIRALREARRMSIRAFAAHLGVSERMVSKWESGGETIRPRTVNQAALDTSLATCNAETRTRFERLAGGRATHVDGALPSSAARHLVRHPIDGKLMTLIEPGPWKTSTGETLWLAGYYIDVLPTTCGDYSQFVAATGHRPPSQWPDGTYPPSMADTPVQVAWTDAQAYVTWASKHLPTAVQWDRAADGDEGMVPGHLPEWCATPRGARRHESPSGSNTQGSPTFRCVVSVEEMLALLAI